MTQVEPLGPGREFDLIRSITRDLPEHPRVLIGPGDDAAVLSGGLVISCDASVENVHFRRDWLSAEDIGYRAAAVALSDIAAMAAQPTALLVSLLLPARDYGDYALSIMQGVRRAAELVGAALAGGDITRTDGPLAIDVMVLGTSEQPVLRSGATQGDEVWVTGVLGGAATAVAAWRAGEEPGEAARAAFVAPRPRVAEARWLAQHCELHTLIDLSDGLVADLRHVASASNVAITVRASDVPKHPALRTASDAFDLALAGGDDYELCFTAPPGVARTIIDSFQDRFGISITCIGQVSVGSGVQVLGTDGQPLTLTAAGYDHFAELR
jgi:thiamine-monophosphate kinase